MAAATFEDKRKLVELLIDRVVVSDDNVEIRYVIPTSPQSEHVRFMHLRSDYFGDPPLIEVRHLQLPRQVRVHRAGVARVCHHDERAPPTQAEQITQAHEP